MTPTAATTWRRLLLALLSLVLATLVLWPDPAKPRTITWEDLLFPLVPGGHITRDYLLSPPRRGEERDVVFTARRDHPLQGPATRIEIHIVDKGQWSGIRETKSFGVAYENPRSQAPPDDLEAVTETIANHLRANDLGFSSVASIPLAAEPAAPWLTRMFEHAPTTRGLLALLLIVLALGFVVSIPQHGDTLAGTLLFALGLGLRLPHLDVPFTHDQDVQRFFTGQYPLLEILTGNGLDDRHPPLWFVVLHIAGLFGQTETIARFPAVLCGAALGPTLIWAARLVRTHAGFSAALCGLIVTLSPTLVMRSREVSEIPLFALLVFVAIALATRLSNVSTRSTKRSLAVVTALLAWTYYLAPLVLLGIVLSMLVSRRFNRDVLKALAWGALGGAPAFVLGARAIVRDHSARTVAGQFPQLAWGEHTATETLAELWMQAVHSVGVPIMILATLSMLVALRRRHDPAPIVAFGVTATTAFGIAIASQFARVQPYYLVSIAPALALCVALGPSKQTSKTPAWWGACAASLLWLAGDSRRDLAPLYLPDADAFMHRFSSFVLQRSETRIIVVAHYDATLLAYYVEREVGGDAAWPATARSGELLLKTSQRRILPLAHAHGLDGRSDEQARNRLLTTLEEGPALVIERDAFILPHVHDELGSCEVLLDAPSARLLACAARSAH